MSAGDAVAVEGGPLSRLSPRNDSGATWSATIATTSRTWRVEIESQLVVRFSAVSGHGVHRLSTGESTAAFDRLSSLAAEVDKARNDLSAALFEIIACATDAATRGRLITARRDLFNLRLKDADATRALAPGAADEIGRLLCTVKERESAHAAFVRAHSDELARARVILRKEMRNQNFIAGVQISSASLADSLAKLLEGAVPGGRARQEQIERGLLRYFVRAAMKATPFAAFCVIVPGCVLPGLREHTTAFTLQGAFEPQRRVARLNRNLHTILWSAMRSDPTTRRLLTVDWNPTFSATATAYRVLTQNDGKETFRTVRRRPELEAVVEALEGHLPATVGAAATRIAATIGNDEGIDHATAYLERLIDIGLLQYCHSVADTSSDWHRELRSSLECIDSSAADSARELLDLCDTQLRSFDSADARGRAQALLTLRTRFDENALIVNGSPAERSWLRRSPLYEDATADAALDVSCTPAIAACFAEFSEYFVLTIPLATPRVEQACLRWILDQHHDGRDVPVLEFYEQVYRHFMKEAQSPGPGGRAPEVTTDVFYQNPFQLESVARITAARTRLREYIRTLWAQDLAAEEIQLPLSTIRELVADAPPVGRGRHSVSLFCHFARSCENSLNLILPNGRYATGYGRYYSRFTHLFDADWIEGVRARNAPSRHDEIIEVEGSADFNANMHVGLTPRTIAYPTTESRPDDGRLRVQISELVIGRNPDDCNGVILRERASGRVLTPLDCGFLSLRLRPALFQLVNCLSSTRGFGLPVPALPSPVADESEPITPQAGVILRPRLRVGNNLIMWRRAWTMHVMHVVQSKPGEPPAAFFERCRVWRASIGIPETAYVRLHRQPLKRALPGAAPVVEVEGNPVEENRFADDQMNAGPVASKDWAKPIFVDFRSPLLVAMFGHLLAGAGDSYVTVEEQLPADHDSALQCFQGRAAEFTLQFSAVLD